MGSPRSTWSGSISFGLVNIPVKLCNVVTDRKSTFNQFTEDGHPVGRKEFDKITGEDLSRDAIRRGRQVGRDGPVVLVSDSELEQLAPESTKTIIIDRFVPDGQISPLFWAKDHYAMPEKGGETSYALLLNALAETDTVAVGRVVLRDREHVVEIRSEGGALLVTFLHFDDEVRKVEELGIKHVEVDDQQLKLARQLIEASVDEWDAAEYKDSQSEAIEALVSAKLAGVDPKFAEGFDHPLSHAGELADLLAASVDAVRAKKGKKK